MLFLVLLPQKSRDRDKPAGMRRKIVAVEVVNMQHEARGTRRVQSVPRYDGVPVWRCNE